ncbi:hypothetical protein CBR_g51238 [Chara braunii]|uniref:LysM domain-containing protein n=1 Tax=Chara braunii TaxID=69332 RepID=A0A388M846_CHABU|nr:hypothetical protein CBR_g51238 [Chara braunii]|eukprot:GBG90731.1 hypothetical protein CBR_g51238 [Chara braunii]
MKKVGGERAVRREGGSVFEEILMKEEGTDTVSSFPVARPPPLMRMDHNHEDDHAGRDGSGWDNRFWASSPPVGCVCSSSSSSFEGFLTGRRSRSSSTSSSAMGSSSSGTSNFPLSSSSPSGGGSKSSSSSTRVARQLSPFVGEGFLLHNVTKFDTLAGLAIKYGVEVADIRRCNALVSDVQMFARKVLRIPTPGPFPTCGSCEAACEPGSSSKGPSSEQESPVLSSCEPSSSSSWPLHCEIESRKGRRRGAEGKSMHRKSISPAMGLLRGYYGLRKQGASEGMELAVYKSDNENGSEDDEGLLSPMERRDLPIWESKGRNQSGLSERGTERTGEGEIPSVPPRSSLEEGGGGLGKAELGGGWHAEDTFVGLATAGGPSSRRRVSQADEVVAVVEALSERTRAARETVRPAGAVGCVAGWDEAVQGGITEIVDEKLVRRKTVGSSKAGSVVDSKDSFGGGYGAAVHVSGSVAGVRENGDIANEKGRRGFIPGRGPMPRPKASSGEWVARDEGLNLGSVSGGVVRGKAGAEAATILPPPLGTINGWQNLDLAGFGGGGKGGEEGGRAVGGAGGGGGGGLGSLLSASAVEHLIMKVKRSSSLPQINFVEQDGDADSRGLLSSIGKRRLSGGNLFGNWSNMGGVGSGLIDAVRAVGVNGITGNGGGGGGVLNGADFFGGKPPVSRRNKASVD